MHKPHLIRSHRIILLSLLFILPMLLSAGNTFGIPNVVMSEVFTKYKSTINNFIISITTPSWNDATTLSQDLIQQGQELKDFGKQANNATWEYYASNLINHSMELQIACKNHDSVEAIHLLTILTNHIGEIQSSIPVWLQEYIGIQIETLKQSIANKDQKLTRDTAEILHTSAHKIILSASTSRQSYRHTRWLTNILDLNRLGDELLSDANQNDWETHTQHLKRIESLYVSWKDGFHPDLIK